MSRPPFWFAALLVALAPATALAQPPSPLELVRGLREQGMSDLALELLADLDKKALAPEQKAAIPLERAKTLLDAADGDPDEGARAAMIAEAKEGFNTFLRSNQNHYRAPEASLALARLLSLEAKAQLARAKRLDPAPDDEEGQKKKKEEAAKARPLFKVAATRFGEAAKQIQDRLAVSSVDNPTRQLIMREIFEADLARGINQFSMADTYIDPTVQEKIERDTYLKEAFDLFDKLSKGPQVVRTIWVARAWKGECQFERDRNADGEAEFKAVLGHQGIASEDGKRMVRFFQLRRAFIHALNEQTQAALVAPAAQARTWLAQYDTPRRPTPESVATKFYLALNLQRQAELASPKPKDAKTPQPPVSGGARQNMEVAERLYRVIAQTDNDYTDRAAKRRMQVVRRLLGEADKPPTDYRTFEESQMAALIQMAKLADAERDGANAAALKARRLKIVALLERARSLVTDKEMKDAPADVADVLVRLIYFYQVTDQPYQAAILGEHLARTMKLPGGKPALAGVMGINGYATAIATLPPGPTLDDARKSDREHAMRLARFLDEKFATDPATDRARHRLAGLLVEEGKPVEAYDVLMKVRPGYDGITGARLLQGAVAYQLIAPADSPLDPERKKAVFRKTAAELDKSVKPEATAELDDIRGYISTRVRLALLYLLQSRADPEGEKAVPGFVLARKIAEDAATIVPSYPELFDKQLPTLDGREMTLLAQDARARAVYLWGRALLDQGKFDEAFASVADLLTEMTKFGPYFTDEMRRWQADEQAEDAAKKGRVANLAAGVDKTRRDVIILAVKARMKQGQIDQAAGLIDMLKTFGGSVEANVPVLQQLSLELSAQIRTARAEGKADEATALTEGFTKLLEKLSAEPNLAATSQVFIGASLNGVGEHTRAVEALKKVPDPGPMVLGKPAKEQTPEEQKAVGVFRVAMLHTVRAHRGAKQFAEAKAILDRAVGSAKEPGFASNSLDFRKEVAYLFEAQGAEEPDLKKANALWGQAMREWNGLYTIARKRLGDAETRRADPNIPDAEKPQGAAILQLKNTFYESYFDVNRCIAKANAQLLKTNPTKLQDSTNATAKKFIEIEKAGGPDINNEVRNKFADLLAELPDVKKAYQAQGGTLFLERATDQ